MVITIVLQRTWELMKRSGLLYRKIFIFIST